MRCIPMTVPAFKCPVCSLRSSFFRKRVKVTAREGSERINIPSKTCKCDIVGLTSKAGTCKSPVSTRVCQTLWRYCMRIPCWAYTDSVSVRDSTLGLLSVLRLLNPVDFIIIFTIISRPFVHILRRHLQRFKTH